MTDERDDVKPVVVDLQVASAAGGLPDRATVQRWVAAALRGAGLEGRGEVSVRIVDEAEGRSLNERYRGKASATNVLSFPAGESTLPLDSPLLGDIVLCAPVVLREAEDGGVAASDHWAHLLVHGTLHLIGYDHETDPEAEAMEALEIRILGAGGVANPYAS